MCAQKIFGRNSFGAHQGRDNIGRDAYIARAANHPHRFIVSCRTADYDQSLHDLARIFELVPLQSKEIGDYLKRVLGEKGETLFQEQLASDTGMLSLASNALFLSMIVEITRRDMKLPRSRGLLFKGFVDAMIKQRRRSGSRPLVSPDVVLSAMAALGGQMLDRDIARPELGELRKWGIPCDKESLEVVLDEARKYRFLRSDGSAAADPIEFIHPLWREYFATEYLDSLLNCDEPYFESVLGKRIGDRHWREAIIMLVGLSKRPTDFIKWFAARLESEARKWQSVCSQTGPFLDISLSGESIHASRVFHAVLGRLSNYCGLFFTMLDRRYLRTLTKRCLVRFLPPVHRRRIARSRRALAAANASITSPATDGTAR